MRNELDFSDEPIGSFSIREYAYTVRIPKDLFAYLQDRRLKKGFTTIAQMIAAEYREKKVKEEEKQKKQITS